MKIVITAMYIAVQLQYSSYVQKFSGNRSSLLCMSTQYKTYIFMKNCLCASNVSW